MVTMFINRGTPEVVGRRQRSIPVLAAVLTCAGILHLQAEAPQAVSTQAGTPAKALAAAREPGPSSEQALKRLMEGNDQRVNP